MLLTPKNSRTRPVTQLCLVLETMRRSDEGRIRDANAFLQHFFPVAETAIDRLFVHLPKEVRADLLSNWGIRGKKSALRDDDDKVRATVVDALAAGDIDATVIEAGVTADILIDWIPLEEWWAFWRGATVPLVAVRKALAHARELALFDDDWFLSSLKLPTQKLEKTDVVCAGLTKDQLVAWMHAVHQSGDATSTGLVRALGWETVLAKTAEAALVTSLDALARQIGLAQKESAESKAAAPVSQKSGSGGYPKVTLPEKKSGSGSYPRFSLPEKPLIEKTPPQVTAAPEAPAIKVAPPADVSPPADVAPPVDAGPPTLPRAPTAGAIGRAGAAVTNVVVDLNPQQIERKLAESGIPAAPLSSPPNARALFGAPARDLPPMRPPAATLSGVGGPTPDDDAPLVSVSLPNTVQGGPDEPSWAPPRAEPGDMGWDLVHGVTMSISNVQPKYNFEGDDEPTSDISLPRGQR